jgi:hypothetical protein
MNAIEEEDDEQRRGGTGCARESGGNAVHLQLTFPGFGF